MLQQTYTSGNWEDTEADPNYFRNLLGLDENRNSLVLLGALSPTQVC